MKDAIIEWAGISDNLIDEIDELEKEVEHKTKVAIHIQEELEKERKANKLHSANFNRTKSQQYHINDKVSVMFGGVRQVTKIVEVITQYKTELGKKLFKHSKLDKREVE